MSPATGNGMIVIGFLLVVICVQIAIVRWLFRVNVIIDHLSRQIRILEEIRTQTHQTRVACELLAEVYLEGREEPDGDRRP